MLRDMTYSELNALIKNRRSEPFEEYFSVMEISDENKKKRIELAEKLDDNFLFILILLFTMNQYGTVDYNDIRLRFEQGYIDAVSEFFEPNQYIEDHARNFSYDVVDSTMRNEDDPYYYSEDRAVLLSENEANNTFSQQEFYEALESGKKWKKWMDIRDRKERKTHLAVGGTVKPIDEPFLVGDSLMMFARDADTFGAEAKEIVNCRCTTKYF